MTLQLTPHFKPVVWSIRANWVKTSPEGSVTTSNGLHYDPHTGELFCLSDSQYVSYIGRLPEHLINSTQMELL